MSAPRATMRLQFHRGFTFSDATGLIPYLAALGVSHIYASPIMTARTGSLHGYDTVDPTRINPELGGEDEFRRLVHELRRHEMGIIIDIVPNHMAASSENPWWLDVLTKGRASDYAKYFDIDWRLTEPSLHERVLLPLLGRPYGEALAAGEIKLHIDEAGASIRYFDHVLPLADTSSNIIAQTSPELFNPSSAGGCKQLHELLEKQHYRLAWWRSANDDINWRRFFDINDLVGVRVEIDEVFEAVHAAVFELYAKGLIDGVRVDHIDGLAEPGAYCRNLRARLRDLEKQRPPQDLAASAYIIVEKILSRDETLPRQWETDGTTGYDFMDEVNALQHNAAGEAPLTALWKRISGRSGDFAQEDDLARRQILDRSFSSQRKGVIRAIYTILQADLSTRDIPWPALERCLTEILANFSVYRLYSHVGRSSRSDQEFLSRALEGAKKSGLPADQWLIEKLGAWLGGEQIRIGTDTLQNVALTKFQQLSAPLCAKAVEDTAFYRYGRLISRNDVGFDPRCFSTSLDEFHRKMRQSVIEFPHSLLATATHDHKRGEDVRSRLAVLSELAVDWADALDQWIPLALSQCGTMRDAHPDPGDLGILFQTIVGAWPMTLELKDAAGLCAYGKRVAAWQRKAVREAKLRSDWLAPNEAYENALNEFVQGLFSAPSELLIKIEQFARRIAPAGAVNSLAQLVLKLAAPGVPDIYQGTEYWDLSLVDPDNRAPVDFAARQKSMAAAASLHYSITNWRDGHIKQFVMARTLAMRREIPEVFAAGSYLPIEIHGVMAASIVAFARTYKGCSAIVVVCRSVADVLSEGSLNIPSAYWRGTRLLMPPELRRTLFDALVPTRSFAPQQEIEIASIFEDLPIALLTSNSGMS